MLCFQLNNLPPGSHTQHFSELMRESETFLIPQSHIQKTDGNNENGIIVAQQ